MLEPKRTKYHRQFRGKLKGKKISGSRLAFGEYGLKSMGRGWISAAQLEAARKSMTHYTKRKAKIWARIFPDKPVTKKAPGAPMGAGKGELDHWAAPVRPGRLIFELEGVDEETAEEALRRAGHKIPVKTKIIRKKGK
jgi:large subunit ribosomal protein L16